MSSLPEGVKSVIWVVVVVGLLVFAGYITRKNRRR
jgi:hypothetical protein